MRVLTLFGALVVLVAGWSGPAAAEVAVTFVAPERYTDASLYGGYDAGARELALHEIREDLQLLGKRWLTPGQTLSIQVLDVDLAGRFEPWRRPGIYDVRIMRDVTPPRIRLSYTLEEPGRPVRHGEETVSDIDYLSRPLLRRTGVVMPYEMAMLDDWFRARFGGNQGQLSGSAAFSR
jgi:hypothetical protein